jgi:predicted ATPase
VQRLQADRERAGFRALHCEIDTQRVRSLLAAGVAAASLPALEEAAQWLRGEFLDGLDLPDCYRFQHWCMAERERHGALRRQVLEALVTRLAHEPERALPYGHAMVAADPLAEPAHAALVRLLAAGGRYPEAERHYDWARELLRREVALAPGGPLDGAIHAARRERHAAATVPAPAAGARVVGQALEAAETATGSLPLRLSEPEPALRPDAPPPPPPPLLPPMVAAGALLVGREAERRTIAEVLANANASASANSTVATVGAPPEAAAPARLLLLAGEPGIGKTRLLDHLGEGAAAAGRRVIRGRCYEAEMVRPYGLWFDALRGQPTDGVPTETLSRAAPLVTGRLHEGGNREQLFDATVALLRCLGARQPLALILDDLQWIDEGSAALLHFVARTLQGDASVLLAAAARAGEIDDNRWAKGLLRSLARAGGLQRLDLGPLGQPEVQTLLAGTAVDASDALRQSGGNPLYVIELAQAAQRGAEAAGRSIDALIEERLGTLDEGARDLLAWGAALGREIHPELLAAAAGLPVAEVLSRLAHFERRGLLAAAGQGQVDFAHDLVRQAIYRSISQARRRAIHRQIARALQAASAADPWLHGELMRHAGLADDPLIAARACLAAGEHCLRVFANGQAIAAAERGLAHVAQLAATAERVTLEIGLLRLRVAAAAGPEGRRLPALAERIERAIAAAEAQGLPAQAAAGWEILAFLQQRSSEPDKTLVSTLAAERQAHRADAATRCQQLANSGRCLLDIEADPARGRELLDEAAALAGTLDLRVMEIEWGRGLLARNEGDLERAREFLSQAVALARGAQNHWREHECMVWLATVMFEQARYADVLQLVQEILAAAARMGDMPAPFAQGLAALARLRMEDDGGGDAGAAGALAASLDALRSLDDKAHLAYLLNEAAALALDDGHAEAAATYADEALAAARAVRRPSEVAVALARLVSASGDTAVAAPSRAALRAAAAAAPDGASAWGVRSRAGIAETVLQPASAGTTTLVPPLPT